MNCGGFEQLIAMYVEGDLNESDRMRVEEHLRVCVDCRRLAAELNESQSLFKTMRGDVPDDAELAALHGRVVNEVSVLDSGSWVERWFWGGTRRKAALAGILVLLVCGGLVWTLRVGEEVQPEARVAAVGNPPEPAAPTPPIGDLSPSPAKPVARRSPRAISSPVAVEQSPPQMIKLLTDDPNVIIYWLFDEKGD